MGGQLELVGVFPSDAGAARVPLAIGDLTERHEHTESGEEWEASEVSDSGEWTRYLNRGRAETVLRELRSDLKAEKEELLRRLAGPRGSTAVEQALEDAISRAKSRRTGAGRD